jgi:hypothetical protein
MHLKWKKWWWTVGPKSVFWYNNNNSPGNYGHHLACPCEMWWA